MSLRKNLVNIVLGSALALSVAGGVVGCGSSGSHDAAPPSQTYNPPQPPPPPPPPPPPQQCGIYNPGMDEGMNMGSWWSTDYSMAQLDGTFDRMCSLGVESISLLATQYQDNIRSTTIYPISQKTPADSGLETAIAKAKSRGFKTMLKPHVDPLSGWRGDISFTNEADWAAWFASYNNFIMHYAQIAEDNGVDVFVIGTELKGTSQRPEWNQIIDNIRSVYHGKIVYGANHDEYKSVPFWDKVDYVGIDFYFSLTNTLDPAPAELDAAFQPIVADLQQFSQEKGKKILITEFGYQSFDGTNMTPWWAPTATPDQQEQADCFGAFLRALFNKEFIAGMYIWNTHWDMRDMDGFGIINKTAEGVVNEYYHRMDPQQ